MTQPINIRYEILERPTLDIQDMGPQLDKSKNGNFIGIDPHRFRASQVIDSMVYYHKSVTDNTEILNFERIDVGNNNNYIVPVAVAYHPYEWTDYKNDKSVFEYLNPVFLKDLQDHRAIFLIDQSVEGYTVPWLWEWFHKKCAQYSIDPACIIYLTGDQLSTDSYTAWCNNNLITSQMQVLPSTALGMYIHAHYKNFRMKTDFNELLEYKKSNADKIYLFDCINMRPRPQRILNFLHLFNSGLLDFGNVSMPSKNEWSSHFMLTPSVLAQHNLPLDIFSKVDDAPRVAEHNHRNSSKYSNFVERILSDMYRNSWVSLVAEASYFEHEGSVFVSEKTFKPIACKQPFIILGSRHTLKFLRKLGYRTFHPFIDESYDDLEDTERFHAIVNAIKQIQSIEDKAAWYESMQEILEHNHQLFLSISTRKSTEHSAINKYYFQYFKDSNV